MKHILFSGLATLALLSACQSPTSFPGLIQNQNPQGFQRPAAGRVQTQSDQGLDRVGQEIRNQFFSYIDTDLDQRLSVSEIARRAPMFQVYFTRWDSNQDQFLSRDEFEIGATASDSRLYDRQYLRAYATSQWQLVYNPQHKTALTQAEFVENAMRTIPSPTPFLPPPSGGGYPMPPDYQPNDHQELADITRRAAVYQFVLADSNFDGLITFSEFEDAEAKSFLLRLITQMSQQGR